MSDILDEQEDNKEGLSQRKSVTKFEEGEEEYGFWGCIMPIVFIIFLGYLFWGLLESFLSIGSSSG